jgi:hypothetical protein
MSRRDEDPLELKYDADAVAERAADRLRTILHDAVERLDPFPPFPGAFFSFGIEIEAPGMDSPDRGCVVLGEDGEFYELKMGTELPTFELEITDPVALRAEELKPLEMHPLEYIVYAYNAISKVAEILMERQAVDEGEP